jgi:hypothetical protein
MLLFACIAVAGCGLQRQIVHVNVHPVRVAPAGAPQAFIGTVTDARGPATDIVLDSSDQARNVGGIGRGDHGTAVDLEDGTVADKMRQMIAAALQDAGYQVASDSNAAMRVDAKITEFKVVVPFQFWRAAFYNARMLADISAEITITTDTGTRTFVVTGHGYNVYQRIVPENWQIALDKATADFNKNLGERLVALPSTQ